MSFDYDTTHQMIKEQVGLDQPFKKLKFIYDNAEWRQVKPNLDLLHNKSEIISKCTDGNIIQESACMMDYDFWTNMKDIKVTEDAYLFAHYVGSTLRTQVDRDIVGPLSKFYSVLQQHNVEPLQHYFLNFINFIF